jgi:hypothetical protein
MIVVTLALAFDSQGCSAPTRPPVPPSGGQTVTLNYATFAANVEPILVEHGCDATGDCHGGGIRGTLALSPPSAKDVRFDFDQVSQQVWPATPASSPILTQPLAIAAGGTPHPVKVFASTSDSEYVSILAWIQAAGTP